MGVHPYRPCQQHGEYWVICASWSQSIAIQGKLHALLPASRVHPRSEFSVSRGYRGTHPAVEVRHEDGGWSIIRFKTTQQGSLNLAGATIRGALFDEPPASEGIYAEVVKRVQSTGGWVAIAMTPIGAPVDWLRDLVARGGIEDIHVPLSPEALIPLGSSRPRRLADGTVCDATWIALIEAQTPAHEIPVRIHGEWETRSVDGYFDGAWDPTRMVHDRIPTGDVRLVLGIDHGDRPGKQCVYLIAVDEQHASGHPDVYVLDEYVGTLGTETPEDDARGVIAMLRRSGLGWSDLHRAMGDRVHKPGKGQQKSNTDLGAQIAKQLRVPELRPPILTAKRGEGRGNGSVGIRSRWLHQQMVRGLFAVHPRCARLVESIPRYTGRDDDWKDPIDAIVYGLDPYVYGTWRARVVRSTLRVR